MIIILQMPQPQASQLMTQNGSSNGCWRDKDNNLRPHTISSSFEKGGLHSRPSINGHTFMPPPPSHSNENGLPNSEPVSPAKFNDLHNNYSTIRRSYRYVIKVTKKRFFCSPFLLQKKLRYLATVIGYRSVSTFLYLTASCRKMGVLLSKILTRNVRGNLTKNSF